MTRHINLVDARRLYPPRTLPAWSLPAIAGAALLAGLGWRLAGDMELRDLARTDAALQAELTALRPAGGSGDRSAVLAALREQADARERQARLMQGLDATAPAGTSAPPAASTWLRALAAVAIDGVWLRTVKADAGGTLALEGQATDGAHLNDYLARWRGEPALAGTALKLLDVQRAEAPGGTLRFTLGNAAPAAPGAGAAP